MGLHYVDVTNSCGITRDSINIIKGSCNVYIPSGFTPNRDGLNDVFKIKGIDLISEINFKIFDRAGQVIFMTKDKTAGWDGKYKGADLSAGTYVYLIMYKEISTTGTRMLKGTVTLIR
jgi:gliding motility-associated-like protein